MLNIGSCKQRLFNCALGASLAAFALACAAPSAHALSLWSGQFNISVYQYNAGGLATNPGASADPTVNNQLTAGNFLGSGTYTGDLNFSIPAAGPNQVGAFLQSAPGGTWTFSGLGTDPWLSINALSTNIPAFSLTTAFVITGTMVGFPVPSGTIPSDDGAVIRQGGVNLGGNAAPQIEQTATYTGLTTGAFEILYVETNGLPAALFVINDGCLCADGVPCCNGQSIAQTPLPASLPLFATGLGALGLLGWRRKRKAAA